ncbi:hypothetical protein CONCODRAFT_13744 [Conidiobolus coronatus NRRL 28638]|uniref:Uncharacterized protein n=1 Tax=Conidiobolus coronatus (strain ATCC 28846 / CBS 209.66 / NRRL 28638) TaxID=796925 RepID=A0A137NQ69_CONC2|nr:hypothetical protein CONCODRAFT_13744 [Conidiobolus coronatus NRRL 28638]|eukprot:KXN64887.1 hypothetical protein CONCODRAFT_13744 [Conidiobolus coronatus NRRL 28638]
MKFVALLVSSTSSLSLVRSKYAPPSEYYYDAGKLDGLLDIKANKVCTRGKYGGYDAYKCTQRLSAKLDIALNVDLNVNLDLGH